MHEFNVNSSFLYTLTIIVIVFVLAQSTFFLIKAWRQAKKIGIDMSALKRTVSSSAIFSIAPSVSILLGVITLSKFLGLPLPWLRLSVVGALTYELPAASAAAVATNSSIATTVTDPSVFATIAWVMTLGIILSLIIPAFALKKIQSGVLKIGAKDKKWGEVFMSALFLGMISAFLGLVFKDVSTGLVGWIPIFVLLCSAILMMILGTLVKKYKVQWLENYALPFSMLGAMALSIPITNWIAG